MIAFEMRVRSETPDDCNPIRTVNTAAFGL